MKRFFILLILFLLLSLSFVTSAQWNNNYTKVLNSTPKIMIIGDSTVEWCGDQVEHCYRYYLWKNLTENNYVFDFQGSNYGFGDGKNGFFTKKSPFYFDQDNEGFNGQNTTQILAHLSSDIDKSNPDIAIISGGINDYGTDPTQNTTEKRNLIITNTKKMIDVLRSKNKNVIILITILLSKRISESEASLLQQGFNSLKSNYSTNQSPIIAYELYSKMNYSDLYDNSHPTKQGAEKIADLLFLEISPILDQIFPRISGIECKNIISNDPNNPVIFGETYSIPVQGDYDGDGKTDVAVFKDGKWRIKFSNAIPTYLNNSTIKKSDSKGTYFEFGTTSQYTVPADYDGDGKTDLAFYNPTNGIWWIYFSNSEPAYMKIKNGYSGLEKYGQYTWGSAGMIPIARDYDGDNKTDLTFFNPTNGSWWIWFSNAEPTYMKIKNEHQGTDNYGNYIFGAGSKPAPADYDGDGKTDLAFYVSNENLWRYDIFNNSVNGRFWVWYSNNETTKYKNLNQYSGSENYGQYKISGQKNSIPVPKDYDGDNKADLAIFNKGSGWNSPVTWEIIYSSTGQKNAERIYLGDSMDIPVPGDYDGDEKDEIVSFHTTSSTSEWLFYTGLKQTKDFYDTQGNKLKIHDYSIIRANGKFYMYGSDYTNNPQGKFILGGANKTENEMHNIRLYESTDLINWTNKGILINPISSGLGGAFYAPKVLYNAKNNNYVLWTSWERLNAQATGIFTSSNPDGPFTLVNDKAHFTNKAGQRVVDYSTGSDLFLDDDGKAYTTANPSGDSMIQQLNDDFTDTVGSSTVAIPYTPPKEIFVSSVNGTYSIGSHFESVNILKIDGKYIVMASGVSGWSPTQTHYAVSNNPLGPYGIEKVASENNTWQSQIRGNIKIPEINKTIVLCDSWWNPNPNNLNDSRLLWLIANFDSQKEELNFDFCSEWEKKYTPIVIKPPTPTQKPICTQYQERYTNTQLNTNILNWKKGSITLLEIIKRAKLNKYCN